MQRDPVAAIADFIGRPVGLAVLVKLLARREAYIEDVHGMRQPVTARLLGRWLSHMLVEPVTQHALLAQQRQPFEEQHVHGVPQGDPADDD